MNYTVNSPDFWNSEKWTSLQGYINITYKELKDKLGLPAKEFDDYKSDAEWHITFEDGTRATIYNYKDGINYCGRAEGTPKTKITEWHVGGEDKNALELVNRLFGRENFTRV